MTKHTCSRDALLRVRDVKTHFRDVKTHHQVFKTYNKVPWNPHFLNRNCVKHRKEAPANAGKEEKSPKKALNSPRK